MSTIRRLAWSCLFSLSSVALIKGAARAQILKRHRKTAKNKTLNRCNMLRRENKTNNTTIFSRPGRKAKDKLLMRDRKSTRLNSSHVAISYAVFCLKKKNKHDTHT